MREMLDVKQMCELLHVERRTVYRWLKSGKVKGVRVGRKWLFDREQVERLLTKRGQ